MNNRFFWSMEIHNQPYMTHNVSGMFSLFFFSNLVLTQYACDISFWKNAKWFSLNSMWSTPVHGVIWFKCRVHLNYVMGMFLVAMSTLLIGLQLFPQRSEWYVFGWALCVLGQEIRQMSTSSMMKFHNYYIFQASHCSDSYVLAKFSTLLVDALQLVVFFISKAHHDI